MSFSKPKAPKIQPVPQPPAPAMPSSAQAPTAVNDAVRDVISTKRRQQTLLASAPAGSGTKTLLGSGVV
jgi:hypothetical protein